MLQSGEKYENYHGPERTCLCSRYHAIYGRDTTDQNIFVISELLMIIITHHTSSTYTHWRVRDMSGKITTKNEHLFLGRMLQNTDKYENYQETSTSVLGPDVAEHREVRKLPGNIDFSSWAGCCRTPKRTKITTKNEHQFLCRMLQNTEKYENYQEKWTSVLGPDVAAPKTSKKPEFYCKNTGQQHWRTPKSTRITTKNENRRSWSAETLRKFTDETRFRPFQEHRRYTKSTRITTKNEDRRSWRAGNYENLQTKPVRVGAATPETTKIHRRNEHASTKPRK